LIFKKSFLIQNNILRNDFFRVYKFNSSLEVFISDTPMNFLASRVARNFSYNSLNSTVFRSFGVSTGAQTESQIVDFQSIFFQSTLLRL